MPRFRRYRRRHRRVRHGGPFGRYPRRLESLRYRYRPHKHSKLRATTKKTTVRHGTFVAHLNLSLAARKARKGTVTASYAGDATHDPLKINQRVKLRRR